MFEWSASEAGGMGCTYRLSHAILSNEVIAVAVLPHA